MTPDWLTMLTYCLIIATVLIIVASVIVELSR